MGGAIARVPADESVFAHRAARFNVRMDGAWDDLADDGRVVGRARQTFDRLRPLATGGV